MNAHPPIDKVKLLASIVAKIREDLARGLEAARAAEAGATDPQNKAENKYDTRGLELSYLAAGQGRQILDLQATLAQFQSMTVRDFSPEEAINVGALVTLTSATAGEGEWYFLAPRGGGTEVRLGKTDVVVMTPLSPLGKALMGQKQGAQFSLGKGTPSLRIAAVR